MVGPVIQPLRQLDSSPVPIFDNILCGVDGSRGSYEAVRQAAALAEPGARLVLVAVTAVRGARSQQTAAIAPERARRALAHARRLALAAGVEDVTVDIDDGAPVTERLLARARDHHLLAIGAPAMSRIAHILVGGTATEAAHLLTASVLLVRRPPAGVTFGERMLVASDGSDRSEGLVDFAAAFARRRGASLVLVHAFHGETGAQPTAIAAQVERVTAALGEEAAVRIERGSPRNLILATAETERCSLIIVASRRLSGLRALGSLSERLVHDARCSVLVMRPEDVG
jgi:nucleotide-binding universal stress UspA family protein